MVQMCEAEKPGLDSIGQASCLFEALQQALDLQKQSNTLITKRF